MSGGAFTVSVHDLVDSLQHIGELAGVTAAIGLCRHFGSTRVYIPKTWRPELDLNAIGEAEALLLCEKVGADYIAVPRVPYNSVALRRIVDALKAGGRTNSEIARALDISWRLVQRLSAADARPIRRAKRSFDARQLDIESWISTRQ
jgi:hypothetical protein